MKLAHWIAILAAATVIVGGCSNSDNAGPATQGDVNKLTTELKKTQETSDPGVPLELRNKGTGPGHGANKPATPPPGGTGAPPPTGGAGG